MTVANLSISVNVPDRKKSLTMMQNGGEIR